jgi:nitroimidazol reductase NimA-like FMN-containing flavoprotein (pyridoxamine 5'-phosphate oxidase superfamily)
MTSESFERLTEEECRRLLRSSGLGRIGFPHGNLTLVLPVYFTMAGPDILFRTAPGAKLDAAVLNQRVAFEADDEDAGWSVLVSGHADEVRDSKQHAHALEALAGRWPGGMRSRVVCVSIENITGRRLSLAKNLRG